MMELKVAASTKPMAIPKIPCDPLKDYRGAKRFGRFVSRACYRVHGSVCWYHIEHTNKHIFNEFTERLIEANEHSGWISMLRASA